MISFENDYSTGAHPRVLEALAATNLEPAPGYGTDRFCASAAERIRAACADDTADVFFLVGGTQTNAVVISSLLAGYEGVIAADTGHIAVHEAGAIEATGHKVIALPEHDGKLQAAEVEAYLEGFYADANYEHMVFPGMVFIAHPSELGTLYSLAELEELSALCRRYEIPLYLDGARLSYGLAAPESDVTLPDIARLTDAFYIGGTKCGALCGEAVVFPRGGMPKHFLTHVKQHGALLAKGRLLGVQFDTLFTNGLYGELGRTAIDAAAELRRILSEAGCTFFRESPTNQQFVILENSQMEALAERVRFSFWERVDDTHTAIRFVTSWSTTAEDLAFLETALAATL
ncbi:threonine aldolase family protein [Adlercreutzia caecimuris]|uniref:threonine aldolase family protein n=1 Tax=Adlercreutzia caecimuris TaxID=671266 RepID=UPI001C3D2156|nr:beta-eliminating lyase-related protein [Adlercreutzia caecimuris]